MYDEQFEEVLRPHLSLLPPGEKLDPDTNLRDLGLDSLAMVELLASLETSYDVRFTDDALTMENFSSPEMLWKTLSGMR